MATGAAISGSIQYSPFVQSVYPCRQPGKRVKVGLTSQRGDARAFLNQKIDSIRLADSPLKKLKTEGMYETLVSSCKRLFGILGGGFDIDEEFTLENLEQALNRLRVYVIDRDMNFLVVRNEDNEVNFVLYKETYCLANTAFFFYIQPADNMPKEMGMLYRRFINYAAACLGISVMPEHTDNRYLYMLVNAYREDEDEYIEVREDLLDIYDKDGKKYHKFKEVSEMSVEGIDKDLLAYYEVCDEKCKDLVRLMIEGVELLPCMNINTFGFNPYYDGFGNDDSYLELESTLAVLYSPDDDMDEMLIDCINSDINCGIIEQGWNRWLLMSPDMTKGDINELMEDDEIPMMFKNWSDRFYDEIYKWSKRN